MPVRHRPPSLHRCRLIGSTAFAALRVYAVSPRKAAFPIACFVALLNVYPFVTTMVSSMQRPHVVTTYFAPQYNIPTNRQVDASRIATIMVTAHCWYKSILPASYTLGYAHVLNASVHSLTLPAQLYVVSALVQNDHT